MLVGGRHFSSDVLSRIQAAVQAEPSLSRRALSRRVCQWLDWRSPAGRLQEMSCRKALAELKRRGVLALPERGGPYGFERVLPPLEVPVPELSCTLTALGAVTVSPEATNSGSARLTVGRS